MMVSSLVRQTWVLSAVLLQNGGQGMTLAYTSCLLPALRAADSPIQIDLDTASWIASSIAVSMIFGVWTSSVGVDRLGRRLAHLLLTLPNIIGWLFIYFSTNVTTIIIGRLANGFASGTGFGIGSIVAGEFSSPEYRGLFLSLKTTCLVVGSLILHAISDTFHWRTVALISTVPSVISFCINCTWPESPFWLVSKNELKKSEEAFFWLRGRSEKAVREFEALLGAHKERTSAAELEKASCKMRIVNFLKKFGKKDFWKPVVIILVCAILLEAAGRHYFPAFAADIMGNMFKDKSQTTFLIGLIDFITLASCAVTCFLVKFFRRRLLIFFSGITSIVLLLIISLYLFLKSLGAVSSDTITLPSLVFLYFIVSNCGCTGIPTILFGEIFSLSYRESGTAVGGTMTTIMLAVFLKLTPIVISTVNVSGMFAIYAVVMALSLLYLYFALPETTNRTLQEIGDYFNHGKFLDTDHSHDEAVNVSLLENPKPDTPEFIIHEKQV